MTKNERKLVQTALEACGRVPVMSVYAVEKLREVEDILRTMLTEPKRKRQPSKKRLQDEGWKKTREICS